MSSPPLQIQTIKLPKQEKMKSQAQSSPFDCHEKFKEMKENN